MWDVGPWSGAGMVVGLVVLALLAGLVVLLGVAVARSGRGWWSPSRDGAAELLAERFARGEIDEQEYQHRLAVLEEHRRVD